MYTAIKINSITKPDTFINLNNGIWYYNFNITEETVTVYNETGEDKQTRYTWVQVRIKGTPTLEKC